MAAAPLPPPSPRQGLIVDLRDNPGGLLGAAIRTADLFLPEGADVVTTRARAPLPPDAEADVPAVAAGGGAGAGVSRYRVEALEVPRDGGTWTVHFPVVPPETRVVLLVNRETASAAEILAGALQARPPQQPPRPAPTAPTA